jgi:DNA polymerase III delta prime subunit
MEQTIENIPWVEKYRPTTFDNIVLDKSNRIVFENILTTGYFPNLLFYGPPGTGKTTTIMNLISEYNNQYNKGSKGTVIHLNASDERGIEIIRNLIYQFVRTNNFFNKGLKFVILDEVDYMTKNAQHALKYLLQTSLYNVRYCLICNYISKVDDSLKNEFICIRFNQLPKTDIHTFIKQITQKENIDIDEDTIEKIQTMYNSDIRSMINFIQLHQSHEILQTNIITPSVWENMNNILENTDINNINEFIHTTSIRYNIDKKTIIKQYYNYIIRNHPEKITIKFLNQVEIILHNDNSNINNTINYMKQISTAH